MQNGKKNMIYSKIPLLTHCRLNRLTHTIYWKSPSSILGTSGYEIWIFLEKKWLNYLQIVSPNTRLIYAPGPFCMERNRTKLVRPMKYNITKTRLYNFDPLKPHFYIVKLGFTGVYIIFSYFCSKHRLWVLVRTASSRRF